MTTQESILLETSDQTIVEPSGTGEFDAGPHRSYKKRLFIGDS